MIIGERLVLRDEKLDGDDADSFRWMDLEEWQYYDEPDAAFEGISRDEFGARRKNQRVPVAGSYTWQIDTVEGRHIGWVNYYWLDEHSGQAYVGICLPEETSWGQGYGHEALGLLIDYLFREKALNMVKAATWSGNERMLRCAEKCGFQECARMPHRAKFSVRGELLERVELAISRSKWWAFSQKLL
jgi:RimJ/RimL family protein N-acetyltransferase